MHRISENSDVSETPEPLEGDPAPLSLETKAVWGDLVSSVYDQLRRLARARMRRERAGHTLPPTALVHEAFLRLAQGGATSGRNRGRFLPIVAKAMEEVLVDYARHHAAAKRNYGRPAFSLDEDRDLDALASPEIGEIPIEDLAEALEDLESRAPIDGRRKAAAVRFRYLLGLSSAETAELLGMSVDTVKRDTRFAVAWLRRRLETS